MAFQLLPNVRYRAFDDNGDPLVGGKFYAYIAGTSTPIATYSDNSGTLNTIPVVLDANGEADIYLAEGSYKLTLTDADDVVQWTKDDIVVPYDGVGTGTGDSSPWATHTVTDGQSAADLEGETIDFSDNSSAYYSCEIIRGTTVMANFFFSIQNLNGTGRVSVGPVIAEELHGVTFSISQVSTTAQLKAALDVGAGNGTIKLSRRLIPA